MMRSLIKLRTYAALSVFMFANAAHEAVAQAPLRFEIRWTDAAVTGAAAVLAVIPSIKREQLPHATCMPCDPSGLWAIDRGVVGDYRHSPAMASNVTLLASVVGGGLLVLDSRPGEPQEARAEDFAVYTEAQIFTALATQWGKVAFHRARPPRYTPNAANYPESDWGLSFPSGHASAAFAAAGAYWSIMHRRGIANQKKGQIALLFGTATATAVLRVVSRKHFPTDVIAGAALGTAIGYVVPQVHPIR